MRQQAIRYTLSGAVGVVLAVALSGMVNWLGSRHYLAADWTSSKVYSVSDKTRNILADLNEDIRVIVFMTPARALYDQVSELLKRYQAITEKIKVEYIDPDKEPLKTRQLAEQFGLRSVYSLAAGIFVVSTLLILLIPRPVGGVRRGSNALVGVIRQLCKASLRPSLSP